MKKLLLIMGLVAGCSWLDASSQDSYKLTNLSELGYDFSPSYTNISSQKAINQGQQEYQDGLKQQQEITREMDALHAERSHRAKEEKRIAQDNERMNKDKKELKDDILYNNQVANIDDKRRSSPTLYLNLIAAYKKRNQLDIADEFHKAKNLLKHAYHLKHTSHDESVIAEAFQALEDQNNYLLTQGLLEVNN